MPLANASRSLRDSTRWSSSTLREPRKSAPVPAAGAGAPAGMRAPRTSRATARIAGSENVAPTVAPGPTRTGLGASRLRQCSPALGTSRRPSPAHSRSAALLPGLTSAAPLGASGALSDITNVGAGRATGLKPLKTVAQCISAAPVEATRTLLSVASLTSLMPPPSSVRRPLSSRSVVADEPMPQAPDDLDSEEEEEEVEEEVLALDDPQAVCEYMDDIHSNLFSKEFGVMPCDGYMKNQTDINGKMRAILVDWLVEVHMKYRLKSETLFLAVNLIDRYLSRAVVSRKRLQLVGVVAMFIAAKFEEIEPPRAGDFSYITDHAYTKSDIVHLECQMLAALGFEIVAPTASHFTDHFLRVSEGTGSQRDLVRYVLELALLDYPMVRHAPSQLAAAALLLTNRLLGRQPAWPERVQHAARYTEQGLAECEGELRSLLEAAGGAPLQAVRKKYLQTERHAVAATTFPSVAT